LAADASAVAVSARRDSPEGNCWVSYDRFGAGFWWEGYFATGIDGRGTVFKLLTPISSGSEQESAKLAANEETQRG
jgi:hypothetical protein